MSKKKKKKSYTRESIESRLENLYNKIPDTSGCMDNICKENGCNGWCCVVHFPHLFSCEFKKTWERINKDWSKEEFADIIEKSLQNYLLGEVTKGCIFFDKNSKKCKIHDIRPYSCRLYGITPKPEFDRRYNLMLERYKDNPLMFFKPQCDCVRTINGKEITEEETDGWWKTLSSIEESFGADPKDLSEGVTYMSHHDHILSRVLPEYTLENLSKVRQFGKKEEKDNTCKVIMDIIRKSLGIENAKKE